MSNDLEQLVSRASAGDAEAWSVIVESMENLVWSVVRGFRLSDADAHDATQLTWLRAVERLDSIREPERLGLWLSTIAKRECMKIIERGGRALATDPHDGFDTLTARSDPAAEVSNRSQAERIVEGMRELSTDCQSLLRLCLCEPPVAYNDIAEILGISVGTIGPRRQRCLSKLRSVSGL